MDYKMTVKEMMSKLKKEDIKTWFDLGLYLDRLKEYIIENPTINRKSQKEFKSHISSRGLAFITFGYSVDGVTIEILKYSKIYRENFPGIKIHLIGGEFKPESYKLIDESINKFEIENVGAFNSWDLYNKFFFTKLDRGSQEYNKLILDYWKDVLRIVKLLGSYIEKENISLLFIVNIASNPGNVSLTLATILVSEYLGIPVINNNHDFYWEGGASEIDRIENGLKPGPRDFFFTNAHLGEVFSLIETIFPWESRSWISVNINNEQTKHLIQIKGHNPSNVTEIGTGVDIDSYKNTNKRKKINTFHQFEQILSRYEDTLIAYSPKDVILNKLVDKENPRPILIGLKKTKPTYNFLAENILFLQPTRIISRKRIEIGFKMVQKLFEKHRFRNRFHDTENLKLTILITGPIANGHYGYFEKLIEDFKLLQKELDTIYSERIYLAFLFSELDKEKFKKRFENPVDIVDLYNIASLILLPSETEGRGLPIIEASASGKPIFCSRYFPEHVYSHVIGEHLPEKDRLKVIEYDGKKIKNKSINRIIDEVFFPHTASDIFTHNQNVVKKRYSLESLNKNIQQICGRLYYQLKPTSAIHKLSIEALEEYSKIVNHKSKDLEELINIEKRHYLPGFGRLSFMLYLESLIDPSAFRVEEQEIRGMTYSFAQEILENDPNFEKIHFNKLQDFFNAINFLFEYNKGSIKLQHDHSFAYRHRNKKYYPYQDFTYQELTGLVNMLYLRIIQPKSIYPVDSGIHFFTDWNLALAQMTSSSELVIDDRDVLIEKLKANIPIAVFSGKYVRHELEFFVLQAFRSRYGLKLEQELTEEILKNGLEGKKKIYLFVRRQPVRGASPADQVLEFIKSGKDQELKLLLKYKLLVVVKTNQWCVGIHFAQTGPTALKYLKKIKNEKGLIISHHRNAAVMTDIVDIDRIHIDRVSDPLTENILGVPEGAGYIQFVPASVRTTLAYPTPVQTAFDFHKILKSKRFINLCKTRGKDEIFKIIREDAIHKGTPLNELIDQIVSDDKKLTNEIESNNVTGVYKDQMPWNGAIARTNTPKADQKWKYIAVNSKDKTKTVEEFIKEFEIETRKKVNIAWNGGYILNPELVGKLGLSESYIGSPLGLLISEHKTLCPPLFNKPALLVFADGTIDIQRVSVKDGFEIFSNKKSLNFSKEHYNVAAQSNGYNFYDLLYTEQEIGGDGCMVVRLAGNTVKEILDTKNGPVPIIPVGITLSFSPKNFPRDFFEVGKEVEIKLKNFENIEYAVEAGPMLLDNGELSIDMEAEGWKHENSIRTQAARLDYLDMRGPKIAVGINNEGNLAVLTINGRIRESVGATHTDMGDILKNFGFKKAMGFDPGGSSTLVVGGKVLNISPYNQDYQRNKYSLPPEPRAVSNAVLGILEKK